MIGVFDSGVGGLTFVRALKKVLPQYPVVYFGDTARVPYGNKSSETVKRYTKEAIDFLHSKGAQVIVIACHTASSTAGDIVRSANPVPVFNVLDPIGPEVLRLSKNGRIGIIGTTATIASRKHQQILETHFQSIKTSGAFPDARLEVIEIACPLFVPLIEEGFIKRPETKRIIRYYLRPFQEKRIDALVLACTHYPLLKKQIQEVVGKKVAIIDPSEITAQKLKEYIESHPEVASRLPSGALDQFFVSDNPEKFNRFAKSWLGQSVHAQKVVIEK